MTYSIGAQLALCLPPKYGIHSSNHTPFIENLDDTSPGYEGVVSGNS